MELILERELDHQKKAVDSMMSALDGISVKNRAFHMKIRRSTATIRVLSAIYRRFRKKSVQITGDAAMKGII